MCITWVCAKRYVNKAKRCIRKTAQSLRFTRKAICDIAELVFGKHVQKFQRFITDVVRHMFCIRRNPHGITDSQCIRFAVDYHFACARDDVVHLGRFVRVTACRPPGTNRNLGNAYNHFFGGHCVSTD